MRARGTTAAECVFSTAVRPAEWRGVKPAKGCDGEAVSGSKTAGVMMGEGGATLNLDSPFHHPFISTAFTKSFQHFIFDFWAESSTHWTTA